MGGRTEIPVEPQSGGSAMPYTLWSRGRMLGETDLGFVQIFSNMRMGWFHPSAAGEVLMPVLTGPGPAVKAVGRLLRDPVRQATRVPADDSAGEYPPDIRKTTAYADLVSSVDELESMDLQVRDPDGAILEIQHVGIDDTEFKLGFLTTRERRLMKKALETHPWEPEPEPFPRYQIQVHFPGPMLDLTDASATG